MEKNLTVLNYTRQPDFEAMLRLQIQKIMKEQNLTKDEAEKYLLDSYIRLEQVLNV